MSTKFQEQVYELCSMIPQGKVSTYKEIAKALGNVNCSRAVGNALNKNPYAPCVPCHRVINSDGKLGGFAFGTEKKVELLKEEGVRFDKKVICFEDKLYKF
jgi:methylated-DNA-[protein]-cysteine S-methyltransferase